MSFTYNPPWYLYSFTGGSSAALPALYDDLKEVWQQSQTHDLTSQSEKEGFAKLKQHIA